MVPDLSFLQFALGFFVLVAASYLGTTMALRSFFDGGHDDPRSGNRRGED